MDNLNKDVEQSECFYDESVFDLKKHTGVAYVADFLKTFNLDDLKSRLSMLSELSRKKHNRSLVISICSEKGGAGKSTISVCLSQLFANLGFSTLLIDTDNLKSSSKILDARKNILSEYIISSQENGVSQEDVIGAKELIEPLVDTKYMQPKLFSSSTLNELIEKCEYDFIFVDTAGRKDEEQSNYDIKKLHHNDVPNITTGYLSNAIILPMRTTVLEMTAMVANYVPLYQFIEGLKISNKRIVNTQFRILPSQTEKNGSGLKDLQEFKEDLNFNIFETHIRRSEKIASTVNDKNISTLYSNKVAKNVIISFINVANELANDINHSLQA